MLLGPAWGLTPVRLSYRFTLGIKQLLLKSGTGNYPGTVTTPLNTEDATVVMVITTIFL